MGKGRKREVLREGRKVKPVVVRKGRVKGGKRERGYRDMKERGG